MLRVQDIVMQTVVPAYQLRAGVDYPRNYAELRAWFPDDAACLDYLEWLRWPDGFVCPRCETPGHWRMGDGRFWCAHCQQRISVTAGTIFHATRTPLTVWFAAAALPIWALRKGKSIVAAVPVRGKEMSRSLVSRTIAINSRPVAILIGMIALLAGVDAVAIEEPKYAVMKTYPEFEVRRYEPFHVAETEVTGDFDEVGNQGLSHPRRLPLWREPIPGEDGCRSGPEAAPRLGRLRTRNLRPAVPEPHRHPLP